MVKKNLMETGILIRMDIAHFTLWHCYLEIDWRWKSVAKRLLWLLTSFRWYDHRVCPWSSWTIPAEIVVETSKLQKTARRFYNHIGIRWSYLLKSNFKNAIYRNIILYMLVYEVIIKWYANFISYLLIFPPCFN